MSELSAMYCVQELSFAERRDLGSELLAAVCRIEYLMVLTTQT